MTHISGAALGPDGAAYAGAVFSFVRLPAAVVAQSGGVVTPLTITATADAGIERLRLGAEAGQGFGGGQPHGRLTLIDLVKIDVNLDHPIFASKRGAT